MTQTAPRAKLEQSVNMSPLQPAWLRPAAITLIVIAHIAFFAAFMAWEKPSIVALESMTMDLVQEGDFFEAEEVAEAEDRPPPVVVEDPELALPPPEVMAPDAIPLPAKRDNLEKVEKLLEKIWEIRKTAELTAQVQGGANQEPDNFAKIEKLARLFQSGAITEAEFASKKAVLLKSIE